jgi:hypothetical protein
MNKIDSDILDALKTVAGDGESRRLLRARKRHDERTKQRFETQMELLSDEIERVIPRNHPLFESVMLLTVIRKLGNAEHEYIPDFERGFPQGW